MVNYHIQPVAEGEEGIAGHRRALQAQLGVFGLDAGNAGRVQSAHLACAYAHGHAVLAEHDGIAFDEFGYFPGKEQILHLLGRRLLVGNDFQVVQRQFVVVGRLQQQARADALGVHGVLAFVPGAVAAGRQGDFHQAHIGLGFENLQRLGREIGRHQHFDKLFDDQRGGSAIQRAVECDDAAEGAGRVGLEGFGIRLGGVFAHGHAAGVGVLDDDAGRRVELLDAFPGRIGVGNVVVAQLFALQLLAGHDAAGRRVQVTVQRSVLVGVFSVAQVLHLDKHAVALRREQGALGRAVDLRFVKDDGGQIVADGAVVLRDAIECSYRQRKFRCQADAAADFEFCYHLVVLAGIGQHGHVFPVLGARAHHGRAANVDVFDGISQRAAGLGYGGFKGVEVHAQNVDGGNVVRVERRDVLGQIAPRQQAAVDFGVQGFDAAVEHFGEAGMVGHLGDRQATVGQQLGRSAGREQPHAQGMQVLGQFDDAGFVRDGEQGGKLRHGSSFLRGWVSQADSERSSIRMNNR